LLKFPRWNPARQGESRFYAAGERDGKPLELWGMVQLGKKS